MTLGSTGLLTPARVVGFLIGMTLADWITSHSWWGVR